jgi:hypothetical protein
VDEDKLSELWLEQTERSAWDDIKRGNLIIDLNMENLFLTECKTHFPPSANKLKQLDQDRREAKVLKRTGYHPRSGVPHFEKQ